MRHRYHLGYALPLYRRPLVQAALWMTLPLLLLGSLLLVDRYRGQRQLALQTNLEHAQQAALSTHHWVDGQQQTLSTVAAATEMQSGSCAEQRAYLHRQARLQGLHAAARAGRGRTGGAAEG